MYKNTRNKYNKKNNTKSASKNSNNSQSKVNKENINERVNIQWFPGHMTKAIRDMQGSIGMVDAVCEMLDARIPYSSHNPDIDEITKGKPRIILLNRIDLADPNITNLWTNYYREKGYMVLQINARNGKGLNNFSQSISDLLSDKIERYNAKGQIGHVIRLMVVGIPNVGKSTFINKVAGRKVSQVGDRPGVTKGKQWIKISGNIELMDTPGILWPKFESKTVSENLAFTNAIKSEILDKEELASDFFVMLKNNYPQIIIDRYKFTPNEHMTGYEMLIEAARKRGYLMSGGEVNTERMASTILTEYHSGKLGKISLEKPNG